MAKLALKLNFDPREYSAEIADQFRSAKGKHPGLWGVWPRAALFVGVVLLALVAVWAAYSRTQLEELDQARASEETLKNDYKDKLKQAINLDVLKRQREQVTQYVTALEKQLPSKAEMDQLLSDINQAGVGRGLAFELFRPGSVVAKEYYAELPISVKVVGNYHDIGSFTSDIANLPRIVTLNNLTIAADPKGGPLTLDATAKTFRYLDAEEVAAQRREAAKKNTPGGAAPAAGAAK